MSLAGLVTATTKGSYLKGLRLLRLALSLRIYGLCALARLRYAGLVI